MPTVISFANVTKRYGGWPSRSAVTALENLSIEIEGGSVHGLLGPNRSGKTTFVKLLLGLCKPTSGSIQRLGEPVSQTRTLARVGYVHENQLFPRYLSARELLWYYGSLSLTPQQKLGHRVDSLLSRVGLADRANEPITRFSKGMVQRLGLAQALVNEPDLLILDEPTEGLDLTGRQLLRDVIKEQKSRGATTLLISHVLPEVEAVCDRVTVLSRGQAVKHASVADLTRDPKTGASHSLETALRTFYEAKTT